MVRIYVDADACPVRDEVYKVALRLGVEVLVVSNGSRPILPSRLANVRMVVVPQGADAADDWIAERITDADICVTGDIPLASRCLAKKARALSHNGRMWTGDNIGNALAGREIARHMRENGLQTRGPAAMSKTDKSRFLQALDEAVRQALRAHPGTGAS